MTTRLYYSDAEARVFDAVVLACEEVDGRFVVRLDRTAFYPTSGGQPFDTGAMGRVAVVDVVDGDEGEVLHVTTGRIEAGAHVRGEIDWPRRVDHMQQHTGQHVLSAAFDRLWGARTVSFHMGAELSTIDLARELSPSEIEQAETAANAVVWDDRPVHVRFVSADEAARLPLRKPSERAGDVRLVEVPDFDLSACGGTHVRTTGAVGVIAIAGWERFKGGTRVAFVCGGRALAAHRRLRDAVAAAGRLLSVGADDLPAQIERLQLDLRQATRLRSALQGEMAQYRAREWRASAETIGGRRVVLRVDPESDAAALKGLAQALVAEPPVVVVLVGAGHPAPVVVARSAGEAFDAGAFVRALTGALGGRGGGRAELAQAGVPAEPDRIVAFVRQALAS
jgi:alanyl-tRNA synthetase